MAWLSGYLYRKAITLTGGTDGAQVDFQVKLSIAYDSDMLADFSDLRFTDADGETLIDAWLEDKTDGTSADVWVEFPTTPADGVEQIYYMYYGKADAVSDWDGDATFAQYYAGGSVGSGANLYPDNSLSFAVNDYAMRTRSKTSDINGDRARLCIIAGSSTTPYDNPASAISVYAGILETLPDGTDFDTSPDTDFHTFDIYGSTSQLNLCVDDNEIETQTTNIPSPFYMAYRADDSGGPAITLTIDWGFIRKYAANPPTYGFGSEENAPTILDFERAIMRGAFRGIMRGVA